VNEAIALAGLGRLEDARKIAQLAEVNLNRNHMLTSETGKSNLYLAFLLAQAEDPEYATQLYNRQLDVKAQKFYANNSRDTTAMLAQLENSHERQAEREIAAARESALQALTIKRHRNLNRALIVLSIFMAIALISAFTFVRYRGKVLKKLEIKTQEAASAEKLKSEFLGMISHELRTPLNGIIGISDYLTNHHADHDIREKTSIILRSGNELLSVVQSLTDMARIDAGQLDLVPGDTDLGAALATVAPQWTEAARAKGLIFTSFIDPDITTHHVDEDRILQCIHILMANAISFTDSGRVHLHITASKTEPTTLTAIVADTGQGMSDLVQSRLFTPFMQADASLRRNHMGTGLSLAIAYALIEMMEGDLTVFSREGRGSEFKFTVPLKPASLDSLAEKRLSGMAETQMDQNSAERPDKIAKAEPEYVDLMQPAASQVRAALHRKEDQADYGAEETGEEGHVEALPTKTQFQAPLRILIVDDIASNRDILRVLLERRGHICREAAEGLTALKSLDRNPCDIVIMDIHMPLVDGVEATRRIRKSGRSYENIPIIVLTADNDPKLNAEMMEAGTNLFLTKPVTQASLFQSIEKLRKTENIRILSRSA
jgi:signal transduction histidine kinase/ActR/RegA family two-component response regulator